MLLAGRKNGELQQATCSLSVKSKKGHVVGFVHIMVEGGASSVPLGNRERNSALSNIANLS